MAPALSDGVVHASRGLPLGVAPSYRPLEGGDTGEPAGSVRYSGQLDGLFREWYSGFRPPPAEAEAAVA